MGPLLAMLFLFFACSAICFLVAQRRNANSSYWFMMGALFGPLALPFVFFAQPRNKETVGK